MKKKIGIVGLGRWGRNYVTNLEEYFSDQAELVAAFRKSNIRPDFLPDACQLSTDVWNFDIIGQLDGIIAAADQETNLEIAQYCHLLKFPLLLEKPVALSKKQLFSEFLERDISTNLIIANYIHLFSDVFKRAQERAKNKRIKSIYSEGFNKGPFRNFSSLFDYGVHDLAMGLSLFDNPKVEIEYAQIRYNTEKTGEIYDIKVRYDDVQHHMRVGNGEKKKSRKFEINFDDETKIVCSNNFLIDTSKQGREGVISFEHDMALKNTIQVFLDLIDGKDDPRAGLEMTKKITEILEKVHYMVAR